MPGAPSTSARLYIPVIATLILLFLFSGYYLLYFNYQKDYFTKRNFRVLALITRQLKSKIENFPTVLSNLKSIRHEDREAFFREFVQDLQYIRCKKLPDLEASAPALEGRTTLDVADEGRLQLAYHSTNDPVCAAADLTSLMGPLIPKDSGDEHGVFDDILLVRKDGRVIFQQSQPVGTITRIDFLVGQAASRKPSTISGPSSSAPDSETKNQPEITDKETLLASLVQSGNLPRVKLAGTDYDAFLHPVHLSVPSSAYGHAKSGQEFQEWILCGLIRSDLLIQNSLAMPYKYIIWFIALLLAVVFSSPFLKVWSMSTRERLRSTDGLWLVLFTFMGTGLLTLVLLGTYNDYYVLHRETDRGLRLSADTISRNVPNELVAIWKELDALDRTPELLDDLKALKLQKDGVKCPPPKPLSRTDILGRRDHVGDFYPFFDSAFWVDRRGCQRIKWSVKPQVNRFIDVSERAYFRNSTSRRFWLLHEDESTKPPLQFRMDPIYSWATGENDAVFSMPWSPSEAVQPSIATHHVVTRLLSLMQPVLPPGFGFAVVDPDGKVLFHSDPTRNLTENFFEECDRNAKLRSLVSGRATGCAYVNYLGRTHHCYVTAIRKIEDLPWSLIVFRDMLIPRTMYLEAFTVSSSLFIIYATIFIVPLILLFFFRSGNRAGWVWPDQRRGGDYRHLIAVNCFMAAMLLTWIFRSPPSETLLGVLLIPPITVGLGFAKLEFGDRLRNPGKPATQPLVVFALIFVVLAMLIMMRFGGLWRNILIVGLGLMSVSLSFSSNRVCELFERRKMPAARTAYILAAFCLLIVVGVLPCVTFFKIAHDFELELVIKHGQLNLARMLQTRAERIRKSYQEVKLSDRQGFLENRENIHWDTYLEPFFQADYANALTQEGGLQSSCKPEAENLETSLLNRLLGSLRLLHNPVAVETQGLIADAPVDCAWRWSTVPSEDPPRLHLTRYDYMQGGRIFMISSLFPVMKIPRDMPFWIGMAVLLSIMFLGVRFVAQKVFLVDFPEPAGLILTSFALGEKISGNQLVLGQPFSGKSQSLVEREDLYTIDVAKIAKGNDWAHSFDTTRLPCDKPVAIDHFEYLMDDGACNREKLYLLEELVYAHTKPLVIISTIDPLFYFATGGSGNNESRREKELAGQNVDRWARVLMTFSKLEFEDQPDPVFAQTVEEFTRRISMDGEMGFPERAGKTKKRLAALFEGECGATARLRAIGKEIACALPEGSEITPEQLINEILDRAGAYYRALWASCSKEEKLVLVQLAEEGLVNPKSHAALWQLLRKRLIVRDPFFRIMNESFRRFAIFTHRPRQVLLWEHEGTKMGWTGLRKFLYTLLLGAIAFLFITQRDLAQNSIAVLSGLAASLPVVIKFFSIFQRGPAKRSASD